jgi:multiple sugar transport system substrate-binding protein
MKRRNIVISTAMVVAIFLGLFVTAGSAFAADKKVELQFWSFVGEGHGLAPTFAEGIAEYSKLNPNVTVKHVPLPWDDYVGVKLRSSFAAGSGPDLFMIPNAWLLEYAADGNVAPLNKYLTPAEKADYYPGVLDGASVDGKLYRFPWSQAFEVLYYDKDAFAKNGLQPPTTWDELLFDAKKLTTKDHYGFISYVNDDAHTPMPWSPFIWMAGGEYFTKDGRKSAINTPQVIKALTFIRELMSSGAMSPKPSLAGTEIRLIGTNECSMQVCGIWGINALNKDFPERHIGIVPIPSPDGKHFVSFAGGWGLAVNPKSKHLDEAIKFAKWFSFTNKKLAENLAFKDSSLSLRKSINESQEAKKILTGSLWADVFKYNIAAIARPEVKWPPEVTKIVGDMIQQTLYDTSMTPTDIAKAADDELNKFMQTYQGPALH